MEGMKLRVLPAIVALSCALAVTPAAFAKTIDGGSDNDTLTDTRKADTIRGKGGGDKIYGKAGNDRLVGGSGNDILWGGRGSDVIIPGKGQDSVDAGPGNDVIKLVSDGIQDLVQCRSGRDTVYVKGRDPGDVFIGCEKIVYR